MATGANNSRMNFIIFDLEATCWKGYHSNNFQEIIEIGALKMDAFGTIKDSYSVLVKPVVNPTLSAYCTELTSIEQSHVNGAETFETEIEKFQDWIGIFEESPYQLCSWGNFDQKLLFGNCEHHQLSTEWTQAYFDVRRQYLDIRPYHRPISLRRALEREGLEFEGTPHRALDDAFNLTKLFARYLDEWQF